MKTNTRKQASDPTASTPIPEPTPVNVGDIGDDLRRCAARTGHNVEGFVRSLIVQQIAKLDDNHLLAIPCPFCNRTDRLEIFRWGNERKDGTEYNGEAVRCENCDSVAPVAAWARLPKPPLPAVMHGQPVGQPEGGGQ